MCSVLRWMEGRLRSGSPRPRHLRHLGAAMATLHLHAERWHIPDGFLRPHWDWDGLFGGASDLGGISATAAWDLLPDAYRSDFRAVAGHVASVMEELGNGPEVFGLIHADLHLGNVLFGGGQPRVIDFDDCGFGHRIYDVAVGLWELRWRHEWPAFLAAFVAGYESLRPLPADQIAYLDSFIAARDVSFGLWVAAMAETNPALRARVAEELAWIADDLRNVLRLPGI